MPASKSKSNGKQPAITSFVNKKKKQRRIPDSSDDASSESDSIVEEPLTIGRKRGRPPAAPPPPPAPLYDDSLPLVEFSCYITKSKHHIALGMFNAACDYFDANMTYYDASTEKGAKEELLHVQAVFGAHVIADEQNIKRIVTELKAAMGVRWGDKSGVKVMVKAFVSGQTKELMIGYVRKDRLMVHFNNRNKNITEEEIKRGIAGHESMAVSYLDNKIILTKQNFFQKAWSYWNNKIAPRSLCLSHVLTDMLNERPCKYALSASVFMSSGQMRRSAAEVYWILVMGNPISEYEVRHLLYQPKNAFTESIEYVPGEVSNVQSTSSALFGDSDDDDEGEEGGSLESPGGDAAGGSSQDTCL